MTITVQYSTHFALSLIWLNKNKWMFYWVGDHKNANSKNHFIVSWLTMVLCEYLNPLPGCWGSQDIWDRRHIQSWADLVKIIHISVTFSRLDDRLPGCSLIKMRKSQLWMLTWLGSDAWLNIMKSINIKCVMFLACLFSNWDYNCCVWVVFRFRVSITTNDTLTAAQMIKGRYSTFYES